MACSSIQVAVSIHAPARGATCATAGAGAGLTVSIHAPARGATTHCSIIHLCRRFQSTPPRGGRHEVRPVPDKHGGFNPRPRAGGDAALPEGTKRINQFQSTPPRGGRRRSWHITWGRNRFQSTPPRGGRPELLAMMVRIVQVSIHAPARGATNAPMSALDRAGGFNPRPRAGGDTRRRDLPFPAHRFNPRPRAGGDKAVDVAGGVAKSFNPRPRAGGDQGSEPAFPADSGFNPRPRAGGDGIPSACPKDADVSIHAPARGATELTFQLINTIAVSIHAPARGATIVLPLAFAVGNVSIHAPARGATT